MVLNDAGEITTKVSALFDYETQSSYSIEVTVSDGELQDVKYLTVHIDDVNEAPLITASTKLGDVLENEITPRVVVDMDASDPENDVLTFKITNVNPAETAFTIDSSNGKYIISFCCIFLKKIQIIIILYFYCQVTNFIKIADDSFSKAHVVISSR